MGYLRTKSFLIFNDPNAPDEVAKLDPQKVAEIEAAHEQNKQSRIDALLLSELGRPREYDDWRPVLSQEERTEEVETAKTCAAGPEGQRLREIVQNVQDAGTSWDAVAQYIRETLRSRNEIYLRNFAWSVHEIMKSKATLPDERYVPQRVGGDVVRFKEGGYLGVNVEPGMGWNADKNGWVPDGSTTVALWVKIVDGWSDNGNWGGYLQITCATREGMYIGSSDGYAKAFSSKVGKVAFYDMGNYYEIWQSSRESGRPLTIEGGRLRFVAGAIPARWNIEDATWE